MFCKKYKRVDRHDDDFDHPSSLAPPLLGPLSGSPSPAGPSSSRRFAGQRGEARSALVWRGVEHGAARGTGAVGGAGMLLRLRGPPPWPRSPSRHSRAPQRQARQADPLASRGTSLLHFGASRLDDLSRFLFGNVVAARIRNFAVRWDIYSGLTCKKRPQTKEKSRCRRNESERERQTVADRRGGSGGTTDHPTPPRRRRVA